LIRIEQYEYTLQAELASLPKNTFLTWTTNNFGGLTASYTDPAGSLVCLGGTSNGQANVIDAITTNSANIHFTGLDCDATLSVIDNDAAAAYPAGIFAGFEVSSANLLAISIGARVTIATYLDGSLRQSSIFVNTGLGINASLIDVNGHAILGFVTTQTFDELRITYEGLISLGQDYQIYNAILMQFEAGPALECNVPTRMNKPEYPMLISAARTGTAALACVGCSVINAENAISSDTTDFALITMGIGATGGASFAVKDQLTDYPAGYFAGFDILNTSLINANLLSGLTVKTYLYNVLSETVG
jgi:hypothetical protein